MIEIINPFKDIEEWYDEHIMDEVEEEVGKEFKETKVVNYILYAIVISMAFFCIPPMVNAIEQSNILKCVLLGIIILASIFTGVCGMGNTSGTEENMKMERYIERVIEEEKE